MEMDTPDLETLYVKKINGALPPDEATYLEDRFKKNPQEKIDFEDFRNLWKASGHLPLHEGLSRDERWNKLQQKLEVDISHKPRWNSYIILRYAAAITLIITVIGMYLFLNSPSSIKLQTAYGETKTITLPDQSTIKLNSGTTLVYDPSSWDEERVIQLDGEAYFDVKKNGTAFTVSSNNTVVNVLGTTFNVRSRNETTDVTCLTGKISFGRKTAGAQTVILTQGTGATISGTVLSDIYNVSTDEAIPWIAGNLSFHNTPLPDVLSEIERYFNVSILVKKDVRVLTFTGKFKKPQLDSVLETVCLSAGLKYSINQRSVVIE